MFIPLHDKNPLDKIRFQYVTVALILINVAVFVFFQGADLSREVMTASFGWALVPQHLLTEGLFSTVALTPFEKVTIPEVGTLISYMFLHGGIMHLVGNMAFLWVFGDNVEDAMGHVRFLIFYLLCGIAAGLAHSLFEPNSTAPLIGASGAVSGVIVAYLMLHPRIDLWVLVMWRIPLPIKAGYALGFWVLLQFYNTYVNYITPGQSNVAWLAHVGGIVAGAVLVVFMRRKGFKLFDMDHNVEPDKPS